MTQQSARQSYLMFVGSYAELQHPGIYVYSLNGESGELTLLEEIDGIKNPSFLDLDHEGQRLYSIEETTTETGGRGGSVVAFSFDREGRTTRLNAVPSVGASTCHVQFNAADKYVTVASYSGGVIGMLPVREDGTLGATTDVHRHEGELGPQTDRQDSPHPHSTYTDPQGSYLYAPDLGLDRIRIYKPDVAAMKLVPAGEAIAPAGAGPRHMAIHPERPWVYVINELSSSITLYKRDAETGRLDEIETVPTLPGSFEGVNTCAEVLLSPDGRFVYGSNRGHDSIAVFAAEENTGRLTLVDIIPSGGLTPRNFGLTPDGRYLVCAHQDSGELAVFARDEATGQLRDTGQRAVASRGVCVRFWNRMIG